MTLHSIVTIIVKFCVIICGLYYIVQEHRPDTRELITKSADLLNRWIRLSCYNRLFISCSLNTHVTPILQRIGPCNLLRSFRSIFVYNTYVFIRQLTTMKTVFTLVLFINVLILSGLYVERACSINLHCNLRTFPIKCVKIFVHNINMLRNYTLLQIIPIIRSETRFKKWKVSVFNKQADETIKQQWNEKVLVSNYGLHSPPLLPESLTVPKIQIS